MQALPTVRHRNVGTALAEVGASFADVAKLTVYYRADLPGDMRSGFVAGVERAFAKLGVDTPPPLTGIGVAALVEPDMLVEVEAVAVVD